MSLGKVGRNAWRAAALSLALLSAGCAGLRPEPPMNAGIQSERVYHQSISLEGRLSLRYQQNGHEQAVHGSFTWTQTPGLIVLHLLSPLGQTIAAIDVKPGMAMLRQSGKEPRVADDVNQLTEQALGWPLPVAGLRNWLQGFATDATGKPFIARPMDDDAVNAVTTPDGWRIQYAGWQAPQAGGAYPKRIDLDRVTEQAGEVAIRIVIDKVQAS
jgi:outer membrane lipoprotein LolB